MPSTQVENEPLATSGRRGSVPGFQERPPPQGIEGRRPRQRFWPHILYGVSEGTDGYSTPEEAAMADFDPRYARVVATRFVDDDLAEVGLSVNTPETPYPYFVQAMCVNGRWYEGPSGN